MIQSSPSGSIDHLAIVGSSGDRRAQAVKTAPGEPRPQGPPLRADEAAEELLRTPRPRVGAAVVTEIDQSDRADGRSQGPPVRITGDREREAADAVRTIFERTVKELGLGP
jgi:hypothetical protein